MELYGIADVGSNTIVLLVYRLENGIPVSVLHKSTPVHLIDYVQDGKMSTEGIRAAQETLEKYARRLDRMDVRYRWADITEPCRIGNRSELVSALEQTGFEVFPLSGKEEALYDFAGSRLSCPETANGVAFDIGGGSTELISFHDGKASDAMSFPLGCVRLSHLPLDTEECAKQILLARKNYPSLDTECEELIGIGGTIRAVGLVTDRLYGTGNIIFSGQLKEVFENLKAGEEKTTEAMKELVNKARQTVFLPGIHMAIVITEIFKADRIRISSTGIREGFLLERIRQI